MNRSIFLPTAFTLTAILAACGQKIAAPTSSETTSIVTPSEALSNLSSEQLHSIALKAQNFINSGLSVEETDRLVIKEAQSAPNLGQQLKQLTSYSDFVPTQIRELNSLEKTRCDQSASQCAIALSDGLYASNWVGYATQGMSIGTSYVDNEGDAFRHAVWNALMSKHMGSTTAQGWADDHEYGSTSQVIGSIGNQMDFYNNSVGRNVGAYYLSNSDQYLGRKIIDKIVAGQLRIVQRAYNLESPATGNTLLVSNYYSSSA